MALTKKKEDALVRAFETGSPYAPRGARSRAGGAEQRMIDELRDLGYLGRRDRAARSLEAQPHEPSNLTAKGLREVRSVLVRRRPTGHPDIAKDRARALEKLDAAIIAQDAAEAEWKVADDARKEAERQRSADRAAAGRARRLQGVRELAIELKLYVAVDNAADADRARSFLPLEQWREEELLDLIERFGRIDNF